MRAHADAIGIEMVPFKHMVYVQERAEYQPIDEVEKDATVLNISGTELRRRLQEGLEIPDWFSFPEVVKELRRTKPPRAHQGFTVFFTGLSGSGKSTILRAITGLAETWNGTIEIDGRLLGRKRDEQFFKTVQIIRGLSSRQVQA